MPARTSRSRFPLRSAVIGAAAVAAATFTVSRLPAFIGETVVEVVDGDTFIIANRQPIRLYGLDAPELSYCLGQEARSELSRQILHQRVVLREPLSDGHGRVMALVYQNGRLINELLLRRGLAAYRRQGGSATPALKSASDYARSHAVGIFSPLCLQDTPPDPACSIKGNFNEDRGERVYLPPDCRFYNQTKVQLFQGDTWFCSASQARAAGFTLSPGCR